MTADQRHLRNTQPPTKELSDGGMAQVVECQVVNLQMLDCLVTSDRDVLRSVREDPPLTAHHIPPCFNDRHGGREQRDDLVISDLLFRVFPIPDRDRVVFPVHILKGDPANLTHPHRAGQSKIHDWSHWDVATIFPREESAEVFELIRTRDAVALAIMSGIMPDKPATSLQDDVGINVDALHVARPL